MKVTLIRHTRVGVPKGTCYGWSDVPLAETFEEEAATTRKNLDRQLRESPLHLADFDRVYSSPLTRARKLAAFCGYPSPLVDDRLKEMNMGDWEMRLYDDIAKVDSHILDWYNDYMHLAATGGESFPIMYARVAEFLDELKNKPYRHVPSSPTEVYSSAPASMADFSRKKTPSKTLRTTEALKISRYRS